MAESAEQAYIASAAMYEVGAGGVTLEAVYTWSKRWAEAEADGAALAIREKAFLAHRERMSLLKDKVEFKYKQALPGGEKDKYYASRYYFAEADSLLRNCAKRANIIQITNP